MAGTLTVRELITRWGFKTDSGPIAKLDRAIGAMKRGVAIAGTAVAGLAAGLAALTIKTANYGDKIAKASKRVGVSAQTLQELGHAAALSGTSMDEMILGMRRLAAGAYDASQGSKTAVDAFKAIGITVKDNNGNLKTNETLLIESLEGLANLKDMTLRTALAQKIFGRSGTNMLPMLEGGAAGIKAMMKEARDLGLTLDQDALKASEDFNDALLRLKSMVSSLVMMVVSRLMPAITEWIDQAREWITQNKELVKQRLPEILGQIASALKTIGRAISIIGKGVFYIYKFLNFIGEQIGYFAAKIYLEIEQIINFVKKVGDAIGWAMAQAYLAIVGFFESIWEWITQTWEKITGLFGAIKDAGVAAFKHIWSTFTGFFIDLYQYLTDLPKKVWEAITSGFWAAINWVREKINALWEWIAEKFRKIKSLIPGLGGKEKIDVKVEETRKVVGALQQPTMPALQSMGLGTLPAGGEGRSPVTIQMTNNISVPPGTTASEAQRISDAVGNESSKSFRRTIGDVRR